MDLTFKLDEYYAFGEYTFANEDYGNKQISLKEKCNFNESGGFYNIVYSPILKRIVYRRFIRQLFPDEFFLIPGNRNKLQTYKSCYVYDHMDEEYDLFEISAGIMHEHHELFYNTFNVHIKTPNRFERIITFYATGGNEFTTDTCISN